MHPTTVLTIFYLLGYAAVMAAPTPGKNPAPSKPVNAAKSKANASPQVPTSKSKSPFNAMTCKIKKPSKSTSAKKRSFPMTDWDILLPRAGDTSLCGVPIRRDSRTGCENKPAFAREQKDPRPYRQVNPGQLNSGFDPVDCDHAVELQMSAKALTRAGFCRALESILTLGGLQSSMTSRINAHNANDFTGVLNNGDMKFFLDKRLNGVKRDVVSRSVDPTRNMNILTEFIGPLQGYLTMVNPNARAAAQAIDHAAEAVIKQAEHDTMQSKTFTNEEQFCEFVDQVLSAKAQFTAGGVTAAWNKLVTDVGRLKP